MELRGVGRHQPLLDRCIRLSVVHTCLGQSLPVLRPGHWDNLVSVATLDAYRTVISGSVFWPALARSFIVAASSATLAVVLATFTAWLVVRGRESIASRTLDLLVSSSVAVPSAVAAFGFLVFYLAIARWAPIFGTVWILVLAYSFRTTVAYRNSYAGILQMNRELEDASAASGASRLATFRRIIVPLLLPHMSVAWILLFLLGMHEFTIAVFLTNSQTRTLPVLLYDYIQVAQGTQAAQAAAMAVLFTLIGVVLVTVLRVTTSRMGVRSNR